MVEIIARQPVIDAETAESFSPRRLEREWIITSELIKRGIESDESIREIARDYIDQEVAEDLPIRLIREIRAHDEEVRLTRRKKITEGRTQLEDYLEIAPVDQDLYTPDIRHAQSAPDVDFRLEYIERYETEEDEISRRLEKLRKEASIGVTTEEREMSRRRFRFARDVKMLALSAELHDTELNFDPDSGQAELESGLVISYKGDNPELAGELLNPKNWESRKQLKDRVYEVVVSGKKYIMKEKKTRLHNDTAQGGHFDGLGSRDEYILGTELESHIEHPDDNTKCGITWETSLGSVEFPDGYQFSFYEFEEGLTDRKKAFTQLVDKMREQEDIYAQELLDLEEAIRRQLDPKTSDIQTSVIINATNAGRRRELSVEDYIKSKANFILTIGVMQYHRQIFRQGFINTDQDGYLFRDLDQDSELDLELVCMDLERFVRIKDQDHIDEQKRRIESRERISTESIHIFPDDEHSTLEQEAVFRIFCDRYLEENPIIQPELPA